jgi:hypothetical protein
MVDEVAISRTLDAMLQQYNLDYRDCRQIGVIGAPSVRTTDASSLDGYFARNRGNGQFKMKTTFRSSDEFSRFMEKHFGGLNA